MIRTMSEGVRIRCPFCSGKIAVDHEYYRELVGDVIPCPHCNEEIIVPSTGSKDTMFDMGKADRMKTTMRIQPLPTSMRADDDSALCPHCGAEIGCRDLVCITCGGRVPSQEPLQAESL